MTDEESDEKFRLLSERLDKLPDAPPEDDTPWRCIIRVSLVQLFFVVLALVGVIFLILRVNQDRILTCEATNEFRLDVAGVLFESQGRDPDPVRKEFLNRQISRFALVDCKDPSNPRKQVTEDMVIRTTPPTGTTTTSTSTTIFTRGSAP